MVALWDLQENVKFEITITLEIRISSNSTV